MSKNTTALIVANSFRKLLSYPFSATNQYDTYHRAPSLIPVNAIGQGLEELATAQLQRQHGVHQSARTLVLLGHQECGSISRINSLDIPGHRSFRHVG